MTPTPAFLPSPALAGRRVLAIGEALAGLAEGPLYGVVLEIAGAERLKSVKAGSVDLVLIDGDAGEPDVLVAGVNALAGAAGAPPALLLGSHLSAALVRALMRLPRSDVLEAPFAPEQLVAAVEALIFPAGSVPAHPASGARCWAVTGAVGGSGATTLAIELATMLAQRSAREHAVCLVDLHLADGAAAAYLGAHGAMPLGEFGQAAERIDAGLLAAFATPVARRLDLLACPRDPLGFDLVSREAVLRVLELACETYDWVVLDVPRHRRSWTQEVLAGSDEILVVSELTVPALLAARALSDEIEVGLPTGMKPRIVLNRLASRMFGPAPSMAEAEKALQRKADAGISSDWEAAAASVNLGGPISHHRPKSKIVRDVAALVDRLIAEAPHRAHAIQAA